MTGYKKNKRNEKRRKKSQIIPIYADVALKKNQNKDFKQEKRHLENIIYKIVTTNNKFPFFFSFSMH